MKRKLNLQKPFSQSIAIEWFMKGGGKITNMNWNW